MINHYGIIFGIIFDDGSSGKKSASQRPIATRHASAWSLEDQRRDAGISLRKVQLMIAWTVGALITPMSRWFMVRK